MGREQSAAPDASARRKLQGKRIQAARLLKKMTQKELGSAMGVESNQVARWERGANAPRTNEIPALAQLLGVSESFILSGESSAGDFHRRTRYRTLDSYLRRHHSDAPLDPVELEWLTQMQFPAGQDLGDEMFWEIVLTQFRRVRDKAARIDEKLQAAKAALRGRINR